jgi:hypothetical protein
VDKEVSKSEFKIAYFRHATPNSGWTEDYWNSFYEKEEGKKYYYAQSESPHATRMFIISDETTRRMIFLMEDAEESFFGN